MRKPIILQEDYTSFSSCYQIKLPLDIEVMAYASMNRIFSSRDIETACSRDINFMYLLEGMAAPDYATLARFISLHLSECSRETMAAMTALLHELGEISGKTVFIDGTKIESCANKYTFVWKKAVTKNMEKLFLKITELVEVCETAYGLKVVYNGRISLRTLKRIRKKLYRIKTEEGIVFVYGTGKRKTALQKSIEKLEEYMEWLKRYIKDLHVCHLYPKESTKNGQRKGCRPAKYF